MSGPINKIIKKINTFTQNIGERGVFAIIIALVMIVGILAWVFTAGARNSATMKMVNRYLIEIGEKRRIERPISTFGLPGKVSQVGSWWVLSSGEKAVIFPLINDGIFSPCLGIIDNEGILANIIPLSKNAESLVKRSPPGMLAFWIRRLEKSAALLP